MIDFVSYATRSGICPATTMDRHEWVVTLAVDERFIGLAAVCRQCGEHIEHMQSSRVTSPREEGKGGDAK